MDNESKRYAESIKHRLSNAKSSLSWHSVLLFCLLISTCSNKPKDYYSLENNVKETNQLLKNIRDEMRKANPNRQTNDYLWNILEEIRNDNKQQSFGPYPAKPKLEEVPIEK